MDSESLSFRVAEFEGLNLFIFEVSNNQFVSISHFIHQCKNFKTKHAMYVHWGCDDPHISQLCRHVSTLIKTYLLLQCSTLFKTIHPWKLYDWGWNRRKTCSCPSPTQWLEQVWYASPVAICYGLLGQVVIENDLTERGAQGDVSETRPGYLAMIWRDRKG